MSEPAIITYTELQLPPTVVTRADISRLASELEFVDNELLSARIRATGQAAIPTVSDALTDFLSINKLAIDDDHQRTALIKQVQLLKDKAPTIHMTFAVPADRESLQELAVWVRENVNKQAMLSVGLQPSLVAGVYLRTPNHVHDLSIRAALANSRGVLVKELEALRGAN